MGKLLSVMVALAAVVAFTGTAFAGGGCGGYQSVHSETLITADVSTPAVPQTPVPPKAEPEG
jgi:hypothetical protein